jgi:hypothetical protein
MGHYSTRSVHEKGTAIGDRAAEETEGRCIEGGFRGEDRWCHYGMSNHRYRQENIHAIRAMPNIGA